MKILWRKNVLTLVGMGYAATGFVFFMLVYKAEMKVDDAYDIVNAPLMALIGGSLALAKDLVRADDELQVKDDGDNKDKVRQSETPTNEIDRE